MEGKELEARASETAGMERGGSSARGKLGLATRVAEPATGNGTVSRVEGGEVVAAGVDRKLGLATRGAEPATGNGAVSRLEGGEVVAAGVDAAADCVVEAGVDWELPAPKFIRSDRRSKTRSHMMSTMVSMPG